VTVGGVDILLDRFLSSCVISTVVLNCSVNFDVVVKQRVRMNKHEPVAIARTVTCQAMREVLARIDLVQTKIIKVTKRMVK